MLVLLNPRSNGGAAAKRWPAVRSAMQRLRPDAQFVEPASAAEAQSAIAVGIAAGHDAIVVAGGDGTVNLALNVVMDPATDRPSVPRVALGAIGLGSSNDFHKPIVPERDLAGAPARVDVDGATAVDVGKATIQLPGGGQLVRYFLLNASMGMVADGNNAFNTGRGLVRWLKSRNVDLAIAVCTAKVVAALCVPHVAVGSHGWDYDGPIANVGVLKSVYFAGGMRYDTAVVDDDGQFDVNIWRAAGRLAICRLVFGLYRGRFLSSPLAISHRCDSVDLRPRTPCPLELDGEIVVAQSARLNVLRTALKVCA
jgi:diacylglycerol kinase (ATP)